MDERTRRYYERFTEDQAAAYASASGGISEYFPLSFPKGSRVLDLGCGTARDMALLAREASEVYGVEPVDRMRELAIIRHPELSGKILEGTLPDGLPKAADLGGEFDGILCSAVLQHVPRHQLFDVVFAIRGLLRERGRLLLSVPVGRVGDADQERDEDGRLFHEIRSGELDLLFARGGFQSIGSWTTRDGLGREGRSWQVALYELRSASVSRPLNRIEAILRRDKKVATYKLALIRALADLATYRPNSARWLAGNQVAIPIDAVAGLWTRYFWPFFENEKLLFVPQMAGDWRSGSSRMAFREPLSQLVEHYRRAGGIARYLDDRKQGFPSPAIAELDVQLISKLTSTIRSGPVAHAGVSTSEDGRSAFGYQTGLILIPGDLWRELSLMGHWIRDSLILRWAELSSALSKGSVRTDQVIPILMTTPGSDRDTRLARAVYVAQRELRCTWTDARISPQGLQIDHVIPHAIWQNNDLWNLVPASREANQSKSDQLPSRDLLRRRRDAIECQWDVIRAAHRVRFDREVESLIGHQVGGTSNLFDVLVECVEVTALQRGCRRWEP